MKRHKKLQWVRVDRYDLQVIHPEKIDVHKLEKFLQKVESDYPDYNKKFSKVASKYFRQWFANPNQPMKAAAYCLLSNWFLTDDPARKSTRALHAGFLWDTLFCVRPEKRLSNPARNYKVLPDEFALWWPKQLRCQGGR